MKRNRPSAISHQFVVWRKAPVTWPFWKSRDFHKIMQSAVRLGGNFRFKMLVSDPGYTLPYWRLFNPILSFEILHIWASASGLVSDRPSFFPSVYHVFLRRAFGNVLPDTWCMVGHSFQFIKIYLEACGSPDLDLYRPRYCNPLHPLQERANIWKCWVL